MRQFALPLLLLCFCGSIEALRGQETWPFGTDGRGFSRIDAWNLGIIGAKAVDADAAVSTEPRSGRRRFARSSREEPSDLGPARLRVQMLFPGGPAQKAGLKVGDVITGANGRKFDKGSLDVIAAALRTAESSKGKLSLAVKRGDEDRTITIKLKKNPVTKKLTSGKGRRLVRNDALRFLALRQKDDGGFPETLSGTNGAVVQASLAGLAWIGGGSDLRKGRYRDNVQRAAKFVMRYVDAADPMPGRPGANWDQTSWGYVHAAIFLGELQVRSPSGSVRQQLTAITKKLLERQEKSGGYAHGPGGPNALNYLELNIVTGLALSGLGCAAKAGVAVDRAIVKKAVAYLEASASGDGGVGYSTAPGQKGSGNIGRTAAAWLGMRNLGLGKAGFGQKAGSFVAKNVGNVQGGHASLMQHILLAGVAAQAQGKTAAKKFWDACTRDLVLGRAPDGSIQPRPWHESILMSSNSDVTFGEVWTTAAWAIILGADPKENPKAGLPVWLGKTKAKKSRS